MAKIMVFAIGALFLTLLIMICYGLTTKGKIWIGDQIKLLNPRANPFNEPSITPASDTDSYNTLEQIFIELVPSLFFINGFAMFYLEILSSTSTGIGKKK